MIPIIALLVIGFQHRVTIITYARFGSFFRYSLGDYTRVERERFSTAFGHGTEWTLEYQRANGESERITLRTVGLARELAERNFANQFMDHATELVLEDLLRESVQEHFTLGEEGRVRLSSPGFTRREFNVADADDEEMNLTIMIVCGERRYGSSLDASRVLDRREGIQLYSLTPYTFLNEWDQELRIWLSARSVDDSSDHQLQERFKELVRDVSQSHRIPVVDIYFHQGDASFSGYYFLDSDTFETRLLSEIRAEEQAEREAREQAESEEFERQVLELRERFGGDIGEMHVDVSFLETLTPEQVVRAEEFIFYFADLDEFGSPELRINFDEDDREVRENVRLASGDRLPYHSITKLYFIIWRTEAGDIIEIDEDSNMFTIDELGNKVEIGHEDFYSGEDGELIVGIHVFHDVETANREFFMLEGRKDRREEFVFYRQVEYENNTAAIVYDFHSAEAGYITIIALRIGRVMVILEESHFWLGEWGEMSVVFLEVLIEFLQD